MQDNWGLIKQIELIDEYITDECQEYLYYLPKNNIHIFERIKNASTILVNNAARILRNQTPLIKTKNNSLTLEQIRDLMMKMYKIILTNDCPVIKEDKIKKIIEDEFFIKASDLLQQNPSRETEYIKNRLLLNGG